MGTTTKTDRRTAWRALSPVALLGYLMFSIASPCALAQAIAPQVWIVAEQASELIIVDDLSDTPATQETISLAGLPGAPLPYGIAAATTFPEVSRFVFVSQGATLRAVDVASQAVLLDWDLALLSGLSFVQLKGIDAARPDTFTDTGGTLQLRSYLHVAANVRPSIQAPLQPWYFVLDQDILSGNAPGATDPIVAHGPLLANAVPGFEVGEVTVLGSRAGPLVQRAWYTVTQVDATGAQLLAVLIGGDEQEGVWVRQRTEFTNYPAGTDLPQGFRIGAPHSRDLALLPRGPVSELRDLNSGRSCPVAREPIATSVTGPGLNSYDIWSIARERGRGYYLQRSNFADCSNDAEIALGSSGPTDIATRGRVTYQEVYVTNREADTLTVVRSDDPTTAITIPLGPPPGATGCNKCPRSVAVLERNSTVCRAVDLRLDLVNAQTEILHSWSEQACSIDVSFRVWCKCLEPITADCPSWCDNVCDGLGCDPARTGDPWVEVDVVTKDNELTTVKEGGNTQQNVEPKDEGSN